MDQYYTNFITNLHNVVSDLHRYVPSDNTSKFLEYFDKLDMNKLMIRYLNIMQPLEAQLNAKDDSIFSQKLSIFPGIDMNVYWKQLTSGQKNKIWTYLQMLYIQGDLALNVQAKLSTNSSNTSKASETESATVNETSADKFNPYIGVGTTGIEYGVNELLSGSKAIDAEQTDTKPGLGNIASLLGVDKMLNVDQIADQLKNMKKEDLDEATNNIKNLLGSNIDDKTATLIQDMLTNITSELKNSSTSNSNPLDTIMTIAERVAGDMKPKMESEGVDIMQLWNSTENLASSCKDENGNSMFANGMNPFSLLNKMMGTSGNAGTTCNADAAGAAGMPEMTEQDYMKNCNEMLKSMGMGNIDLSNINMSSMQAIQEHIARGNLGNPGNRSKPSNPGKTNKPGNRSNIQNIQRSKYKNTGKPKPKPKGQGKKQ